jgi:hypothetical protein
MNNFLPIQHHGESKPTNRRIAPSEDRQGQRKEKGNKEKEMKGKDHGESGIE